MTNLVLGPIKSFIRKGLRALERDVVWVPKGKVAGYDLASDLTALITSPNPVCFDVGANEGQSIHFFRHTFGAPTIYAFEPSSAAFARLAIFETDPGVRLYKVGLGREEGLKSFINYDQSDLSSFRELNQEGHRQHASAAEAGRETVQVRSLDSFVTEHTIPRIDLLKIDTQGFELDVLLGARQSLESGIVRNVLIELSYESIYHNQEGHFEIERQLRSWGFGLVDLYHKVRTGPTINWCNGLFARIRP